MDRKRSIKYWTRCHKFMRIEAIGCEPLQLRRVHLENSRSIDVYRANGGYEAIRKVLDSMSPDDVINEVKKSALRGRGGAGFPTGMKWSFVPKDSPKPKYVVCNADESEPGTFKDRYLMERDPHMLIEGMLIAAYALGAKTNYIYTRGEYKYLIDIMDVALDEARAAGLLGNNVLGSNFSCEIHTHTGAGAYICGEETALLTTEDPAAIFHDEFFHVVITHRQFVNAGLINMAGDGPDFCATTLFRSQFLISLATHLDDVGHRGQRLDVVHDSRARIQTRNGREGRLHARMAAQSFK